MKTRHITTNSVEEAWNVANELFPCDYLHDSDRSRRAGYDIYFSTCDSVIAWISDLGDRLEVNLPDGSSVNVWIEEEGEIVEAEITNPQLHHIECSGDRSGYLIYQSDNKVVF